MKYSLKNRMITSFTLIIVIVICIIAILSNYVLDNRFRQYILDNQERKNQSIVDEVINTYIKNSNWDINTITDIGMKALNDGIILKLYDINDNSVWDATIHNNGLCASMIEHMADNMQSRYPNFNGEYKEEPYTLTYEGKNVGYVQLGYYGPFYYTDAELQFINQLNELIIVSGLISLLIAIVIAIFLSKRIVLPITSVIDKTNKIANGEYTPKNNELFSNIKELHALYESVNNLSDKLEEQNKLRRRLTSDMAHELRTPLTSVQGHLEAMIDGVWDATPERLTACYEEILRITRMVNELNNLSRLEGEDYTLNKEEVDISKILDNIIANFQKQTIDKNIALEFNKNSIIANVDKDKISQVFINILSNAIKYTDEGGKVLVTIYEENGKVIVKIKDNGIGIKKEELTHIFERLYRTDDSRSRKTGGSGIGLTIAKRIIELHSGTITINSKLNKGTEVVIVLNKN